MINNELGSKVCDVNGFVMKLNILENIQKIMSSGDYEPVQTSWIKECLEIGDTFIDLGASFGWYTTIASQLVGKMGKIYAFEPSPVAYQTLLQTIKENKIKNVSLFQIAVGDKAGVIDIYLPPQESSLYSPSILFLDNTYSKFKVQMIPLDEFKPIAYNNNELKLIKIDIEGFEPNAIDGMGKLLLSGRVQNIFCEFNTGWLRRNKCTSDELFERIIKFDFEVYKKTECVIGTEPDNITPYKVQDIWFTKINTQK
ncbi:FkbM family methyltransferase [bacterium]|nr:FkbM family methyltransferase [bacterium]